MEALMMRGTGSIQGEGLTAPLIRYEGVAPACLLPLLACIFIAIDSMVDIRLLRSAPAGWRQAA